MPLLQAWNDFVNSSEEQQNAFLDKEAASSNTSQDIDMENGNKSHDDSWEHIDKRTGNSFKSSYFLAAFRLKCLMTNKVSFSDVEISSVQ